MRTELFLTGRYLRPKRSAVSLITVLSILGVTLGVAVLMIVVAVMTGFTDLMKEKIIETQAHFQISSQDGRPLKTPAGVISVVEKAGGSAAPVVMSQVLVQRGKNLDPQVVMFGTSADALKKHLNFEKALKAGELRLGPNEVIVSVYMAYRWGVGIGSKILLHSAQKLTNLVKVKEDGSIGMNPEAEHCLPSEFKVVGIYSMGKYDFDNSILFVGSDDAAELVGLPWGSATAVYGWGPDPFAQDKLLANIRRELPLLQVSSWQDKNRQLLGVLATEKNMMYFLLIFIVLVAAFSIANTLITSVYQKTREIGVLKALGASDRTVMMIFVLQGTFIGVIGSICGTALGFLVITFRNQILDFTSKCFGVDLFPKEFYFFNGLPAHIVGTDVLFIVLPSILLCTLGALLPALRAAFLDPAKALRYE